MSNLLDILSNLFTSMRTIGAVDILINVILSAAMSYLIYLVYVKYGSALSNRKHFGSSFLLITISTTLIIALIKSSIALSLGLVGALSIVRFRTAIKEPQELTYIFFTISMGLGLGANERLVTLSAGFLVLIILIVAGSFRKNQIEDVYNISVESKKLGVDQIVSIIGKYCNRLDMRRFDQKEDAVNVLLFAEFDTYSNFEACIKDLQNEDGKVGVSFVAARALG